MRTAPGPFEPWSSSPGSHGDFRRGIERLSRLEPLRTAGPGNAIDGAIQGRSVPKVVGVFRIGSYYVGDWAAINAGGEVCE